MNSTTKWPSYTVIFSIILLTRDSLYSVTSAGSLLYPGGALLLAGVLAFGSLLGGCGKKDAEVSPADPVNLTVWHYYNGPQMAAFDTLVEEFNGTVGKEKGIYVASFSKGSVTELETAVMDSLEGKVGADPMPDLFSSYADIAFQLVQSGALANLSGYVTEEELSAYVADYVDEGRIGPDGALMIFPVAKSTEIMMLNKTDWDVFAAATGAELSQLATMEGVVEVSRSYYEWTDSLTPDVPDDGKAFYGRDAMANYFYTGACQLGQELLTVEGDGARIRADKEVFRKLWENYYVPMVSGWFGAYGKFRSDDVKTGDLLAYTGSTASVGYFPSRVEGVEDTHPIEYLVLDAPIFQGGQKVVVQQGAGMVVTKSDERRERACVEFLRWFTQPENNLVFGAGSGYLPVQKQAQQADTLRQVVSDRNLTINPITEACLRHCMEQMGACTYYSPRVYANSSNLRKVLEYGLSDKVAADLAAIEEAVAAGASRETALKPYVSEEAFETWYEEFTQRLAQVAAQ